MSMYVILQNVVAERQGVTAWGSLHMVLTCSLLLLHLFVAPGNKGAQWTVCVW